MTFVTKKINFSSMKTDPLEIKSLKTALELLQTAIQLKNQSLAEQCIKNLDQSLNKDTVLKIYTYLSKCKTPLRNNFEPSAPPIIDEDYQINDDWIEKLLSDLKFNCLLVIDKEGDYILKQKEIIDLSYNDLFSIVDRDTLEVSSELVVYSAMYRWGIAECVRMTLNTHHIKEVLRQLCYAPRYGLMLKKEFTQRTVDGLKGPMRSGILEEKEWRLIKFYIKEISKNRPTADLINKMSKPRIAGTEKPIKLSARSESKSSDTTAPARKDGNFRGRAKCEEWFLGFLTCWSVIFD